MNAIHFPLTGNSAIMALVILIHVFFAFFAVGGSLIAIFSEWLGQRKKDDAYMRLARSLSKFLADMMKINGVLGVMIIVLIIGLWGTFARFLYSVMFWPFFIEGLFFLLMMVFSVLYNRTWDRASNGLHLFFGCLAAFFSILAAFVINAIWAFMMFPGKWLETRDGWDAIQSPILWESFTHMLLPCVINGALFIFLFSFWKVKFSDKETDYYKKINRFAARMSAALIFLQPLSGLSFLWRVNISSQGLAHPNPWGQLWSGVGTPYLHGMFFLASVAVICAALYWILGHDNGRKFLLIAAVAMFTAFFVGGYAREKARKPYLVWGHMYMSQNPVKAKSTGAKKAEGINGASVYDNEGCGACHLFQGKGGSAGPELEDLNDSFSKDDMKEFLSEPPDDMPPFGGSEKELEAIANYLLNPMGKATP